MKRSIRTTTLTVIGYTRPHKTRFALYGYPGGQFKRLGIVDQPRHPLAWLLGPVYTPPGWSLPQRHGERPQGPE